MELGLLSLALIAYFTPEAKVQSLGTLMIWAYFLKKNSTWAWLALLICSTFPLTLSAASLNALGLSIEWLYGILQCSPVYVLLRSSRDPWVGPWIYDDSPFHFALEGLVNPWSGLVLALMVLGLWIKRSFATH